MSIRTEAQEPATSELIELFSLDLTMFGDNVYYFIMGAESSDIEWQGNVYTPFDVQASGFELNGQGGSPRPKITFSVTNPIITTYINQFDDLVGAKVIRTKTYKKYLDGEPAANPNAHFPLDIYRIDRKSSENRLQVEFELSSVLDQQGVLLPGRTITASYCPWKYRIWDSVNSVFIYNPSDAACPYTGTNYFDINNNVATQSTDVCAKDQPACKLRFGATAVLPFGGFPGASRPVLS